MTENVDICPPAGQLTITGYAPSIWVSANFSECWYRDALREALGHDAANSIRREIVFAASFLESYIFEWVRSIRIDRTEQYFPTGNFRSLKDKWKDVPGELHRDSLIHTTPRLDLAPLGDLIDYRNGLVHARASRPSTSGLATAAQPFPPIDGLTKLSHGWALGVAKSLVLQLHAELGTTPPGYL
jgi:hypothetical protein